ncbi:MAG: AraC family transcriptional regulator [Pseudomonadota bacterium]
MKQQTQQSYYRRISRVIAEILADPSAPHTVDSLAAVALLSPFHFHRIYRALTGEGIAETVRRLRLAQAARHLAQGVGPVTEIALDAGYDSPQAFARAFREFTGVSPSDYQTRHGEIAASPAIEIVTIAPFEALCLRHVGPIASIGLTYRKLNALLRGQVTFADPPAQIGVSLGDPEGSDFVYRAGLAATPPVKPIEGVDVLKLEGGLYASHRLVGPYALIAPTFQALFGQWLPQSGFEPDNRPALEVYHTRSAVGDRPVNITDLLIPIREI